MKIKSVFDPSFKRFGQVLEGRDWSGLLDKLRDVSEKPADAVIYVPSCAELEALPIARELEDAVYGGMPIQIGYCNGNNTRLNALEYHRDSEINVAADDMVLLLGLREDVGDDWLYDTAKVEAFLCPAGTAVEVYATAMHYAPCNADSAVGFRVIVVLPRGTNTQKPDFEAKCAEDRLLTARNKWLLPHPESNEVLKDGAVVGLKGVNIDIAELLPIKA